MRRLSYLALSAALLVAPALAVPTSPSDHGLFDGGAFPPEASGFVSPTFTGSANLSISTAASYTAFPAQTCKQLTIANNTGVTVQVQQGGSGAAQPVFPGTYYVFYGLTDASALAVSRADGMATAVTVNARCEY